MISLFLGLTYIVEERNFVAAKDIERKYLLSDEEVELQQRNLQSENVVQEINFSEEIGRASCRERV